MKLHVFIPPTHERPAVAATFRIKYRTVIRVEPAQVIEHVPILAYMRGWSEIRVWQYALEHGWEVHEP